MQDLHPALIAQLLSEGVDLERVLRFLNDLNSGKFSEAPHGRFSSVPDISHPSIVDMRSSPSWIMTREAAHARFADLGLPFSPESLVCESLAAPVADGFRLDPPALERIGVHLYPRAAYGVLNGGAATSYADLKKNSSLSGRFFADYRKRFDAMSEECRLMPKGVTPAYINEDGTPGYSFLLLKLRMLLEHKRRYRELVGPLPDTILPAFQMTSVLTDSAVQGALGDYSRMGELKALSDVMGCAPVEMLTGIQPMMAAITHSSAGLPRRVFDRAGGREHAGIAIPGGHGQNFEILTPAYRELLSRGIKYVWIGNIDNMGFTVDPVSLAIFALSGKEAAFEESYRTPMDVKGGILVHDESGRFTCADIGPAISAGEILDFERAGKKILFNCGIGLFDLERLVKRLPEIPYQLPLRITDQDKDAGLYAQAEQITWEIIALIQDPLFFAVDKTRRFIAAKLLMETIMTSIPPARDTGEADLAGVSEDLHRGLMCLLEREYGLRNRGGKWLPV